MAPGLVGLAISGCVPTSPPTGGPDTTADDAEQAARPALEQQLRFEQFGGVAGREDQLTIAPNGEAELTTRVGDPVTFVLDEAQMSDLAGYVAVANLPARAAEITPSDQVDDALVFVLELGDDRVRVQDAGLPDDLRPIVEWLTGQVEQHRPSP